jgi:hypothetical protein
MGIVDIDHSRPQLYQKARNEDSGDSGTALGSFLLDFDLDGSTRQIDLLLLLVISYLHLGRLIQFKTMNLVRCDLVNNTQFMMGASAPSPSVCSHGWAIMAKSWPLRRSAGCKRANECVIDIGVIVIPAARACPQDPLHPSISNLDLNPTYGACAAAADLACSLNSTYHTSSNNTPHTVRVQS